MREGTRMLLRIANAPTWKGLCDEKLPRGHLPLLDLQDGDNKLDETISSTAVVLYQCADTAALADVFDTDCHVQGLRVIDVSILPVSTAARYQAAMHGVAERAAQMIVDGAEQRE